MYFSIVTGFHNIILPSIFCIVFFWWMDSPSISHLYCWGVSSMTSLSSFGQLNLPPSNLLYMRRNPSPSQRSAFSLSLFLPQKRKRLFSKGSRLKLFDTIAARPSICFLMSVCPQAMYIFRKPPRSASIGSPESSGYAQGPLCLLHCLSQGRRSLTLELHMSRWLLTYPVHLPLPEPVQIVELEQPDFSLQV